MGHILAKVSPNSQLSQTFPPPSKFNPEKDIPDLSGKIHHPGSGYLQVAVVTGGNTGIGYHIVRYLLLKNATVFLASRSIERGEKAVAQLEKDTKGKKAVLVQLDLADLASVKKAAQEILSKEERVDLLFNNGNLTGTNVIGAYYLTTLLAPALERSTQHHQIKARVISASSTAHIFHGSDTGMDWDVLKGGDVRDRAIKKLGMLSDWKLYGISKMVLSRTNTCSEGVVLMSNFMAKQHGDQFASCSYNPGGLKTGLQRNLSNVKRSLLNLALYPVHMGAFTPLYAATVPDASDMNGKFFIPFARPGKADTRSDKIESQEKLKEWLEKQVREFESNNN
ncbi:hypothetical protein Clacol_008630 [Clathrus columnatus]|uniref:NAD(P)-binding protein n=1 Tax=Clathrus columnatus TaxID=1419009 RepID=A0AAV5ANB0_9AGAM|nr:hypothetical protein Clacol_008630 [Clathrus columnatus]